MKYKTKSQRALGIDPGLANTGYAIVGHTTGKFAVLFDAKAQRFESHLKPTLNHRRVIFNTASDPDNLIGEAYRETDVQTTRHDGKPPAWKSDDLVFQISSGNYLPRHSLIKYGEDKTIQLEARAQDLIDGYIIPSIEARLKVLVVAPKAFQEVESVKHWAVTELDDYRARFSSFSADNKSSSFDFSSMSAVSRISAFSSCFCRSAI